MAGQKPITEDDIKVNQEMFKLGQEDGALQARRAEEKLGKVQKRGLLTGQARAFKVMRLLAERLEIASVIEVVENKKHLDFEGIDSLDDYLKAHGLSRSKYYEEKKIAKLSEDEVQILGQLNLTRKDLLSYASLPDEKRLAIREGKIINLESAKREDIRALIEDLVEDKRQVEEEAAKEKEAINRVLEKKQETINKREHEIADLEAKVDQMAIEMEIPVAEAPFCKKVEVLDTRLNALLGQIRTLVESDVPGPTAAVRLIALLNKIRMEANHWYQGAYDMHAPANAAPEEEWTQPDTEP